MDEIVRKTLDESKAQLRNAAFAIETVAHLRGRERALLPISDAVREQIAALEVVLAGN